MPTLTPKQQPELEIKGKGAERQVIKTIEDLAEKYTNAKDKFSKAGTAFGVASDELMEEMHKHSKKLANKDGDLFYRYGDMIISVIAGNEKLKVEKNKEPK